MGHILLYTLALAVTVTFLCGLLPAIRIARGGLAGASNEADRTQVSTRNSLQWLLVGMQVALSVTLLAGAGLLVRSFQELSRVNPGFESSRVLTFRVSGSWAEMTDYGRLVQRIDGTLEALRAQRASTERPPPFFYRASRHTTRARSNWSKHEAIPRRA
jgi:putative ABC transport system permease protein